jgi:endonuclease I
MKKQLFFTLLFFTTFLFAQIPAYYNDVNLNLNGTQLKNELATKIISTHTHYLSYSNIWNACQITDLDPNDTSNMNVLLIYGYDDNDGNYRTDRTRSKYAKGGTNGTDWNREHVYAKSLGTPSLGTSGPGSDAHHLRPCDATWNSTRGSEKFAQGSGHSGPVANGWYPGDEWKGDVARMIMYMYLRYGNQCKPTNVGVGNSSNTPDDMIDLFLQWNAEDPVSQIEINRNNYHGNTANTYAQGNRNPFIDNPAFATQIWGGPQAEDKFGNATTTDTQAPSVPTNLTVSNSTTTSVLINWTASTDNVAVQDYAIYVNGNYYNSTSATSFTVSALTPNTTYSFFVEANDAAGNTSNASTTVYATTLSNGGNSNGEDLFFSEYIEGSSYNKALEIVNITGSTINLSNYKIKKQSNGTGSWSSGYSLSGQLASGEVFVIANANASASITSVADITTTSSELSFNGNDPVGLFKNGVLLDIIGDFNGGSAYFAKDVTLQRNANITAPTTTYNLNEWTAYPLNTFDDLGYFSTSNGGNNTTTDVLIETSFETGWDGWSDGGGDCYRIKSTSKASDGRYSIRLRDNSGVASAMTYNNLDISAYQNIQINFDFYSFSMESGENFWVKYYDGATWQTIANFVSGSDFYNNEFSSESILISANDYNFSANAKLRIQCDASSNYDQIYIDNVVVSASTGSFNKSIIMKKNKQSANFNSTETEIEGLTIYPNPLPKNTSLMIKTVFDLEDKVTDITIQLFDIQGRLVKQVNQNHISDEYFEQKIDVSALEKGVYLLQISNSTGYKAVQKVIIQ